MELISGDYSSLKGSFIVYAGLDCQNSETQDEIFACFITKDPKSLEDKIDIPEEMKPLLDKKFGSSSYLKAGLPFTKRDEIADCDDDVLYVGDFHDIQTAEMAINLGIDYYFLRLRSHISLPPTPEINETSQSNYKSFRGRLEYVIMQDFAIPMFFANSEGDDKKYEDTKNELFNFSEGNSWLRRYIIGICSCIENSHNKPDFERIKLYIHLIGAIDHEEFITAKNILRKIKD